MTLHLIRDEHLAGLQADLIEAAARASSAAADLASAVMSGDTASEWLACRLTDADLRAAHLALVEHLRETAAAREINRMRGVSRVVAEITKEQA